MAASNSRCGGCPVRTNERRPLASQRAAGEKGTNRIAVDTGSIFEDLRELSAGLAIISQCHDLTQHFPRPQLPPELGPLPCLVRTNAVRRLDASSAQTP